MSNSQTNTNTNKANKTEQDIEFAVQELDSVLESLDNHTENPPVTDWNI